MSDGFNQQGVVAESRGLARVGILVISDRASCGEYNDESGKAINNFLSKTLQSNWIAVMKIVPDGIDSVAKATGGTGPSPRDLTPEGTRMVMTLGLLGFGPHNGNRRLSSEEFMTICMPKLAPPG